MRYYVVDNYLLSSTEHATWEEAEKEKKSEEDEGLFIFSIVAAQDRAELNQILEAWQETSDILHDNEQMLAFHQGVQEIAEGKGKSWKTVKSDAN